MRFDVSQHTAFFSYVREYVAQHPDASAFLQEHIAAGIREALHSSQDRAADMEACVAALAAKRFKQTDGVLLDKLEKWQGKTALKWDWLLDELRK